MGYTTDKLLQLLTIYIPIKHPRNMVIGVFGQNKGNVEDELYMKE